MQTLPSSVPAITTSQVHLTAAPGPNSSHSSTASPAPFHLNATASTSSLHSPPDTELPAADLDAGRPVRAKRVAEDDPLWDLGDGGDSEGGFRPSRGAQPAAKGKRKAAGNRRAAKGDSEVWGAEVAAACNKAAFELLPKLDRAVKIAVDGVLFARNQLIGWYIFRITGEERRRKQVMSRLQVLTSTTPDLKPPNEFAPGALQEFFGPDYNIVFAGGRVLAVSIRADAAKVQSTPHGEYSRHATPSDSSRLPPFRPPTPQPPQPRRLPPPFPPQLQQPSLAPFQPFISDTAIRSTPSSYTPSSSFEFTSSGFVVPRTSALQPSQTTSSRPPTSADLTAPRHLASPSQSLSLHPVASSPRRPRCASEAWSPPATTFQVASSGSPFLLAPPMRRTHSAPIPTITSPAVTMSPAQQNHPLLVPPAALSCPVTPVALALWLEDGQDGPAQLLTMLEGNGGAGPSGVIYLNENDARFPGVAAMDRRLACQLLHLQFNFALPTHPFATSEIRSRFDLTTSQPHSLASCTTIYSKGHQIAQLPAGLHPATVIDPRSNPLRHGYAYDIPLPTNFWTELLRMPLDPRGVSSFAKTEDDRIELDRRLRGMSMVQQFLVLPLSGGKGRKAKAIDSGSENGEVVLVLLYEFECAESSSNGVTELSFVSFAREASEEPQWSRGGPTSFASNGFALPPPR